MSAEATEPQAPVPEVPEGIVVRVFARTDVGMLREHNEDDFLVADLSTGARTLMPEVQTHRVGPRGSLFVVCDGMGGAAAGEVASRMGVDTIYERLVEKEPPSTWADLVGRLDDAIIEAGSRIYKMARADHERRGMGTTCTAAFLRDPRLFVAQVGDSRCYVLRRGRMLQVTRDQSLLTQLIEAGQVKPEDAEHFEHSNIILQALGTTAMINTDITYVDLRRGDTILLCSDGLAGMIDDEAIREILSANEEPLAACRALTEAANAAGGEDNITVIVARVDGSDLAEPAEGEEVTFRRFPKPRPDRFDQVPYTIPNQVFQDGLSAVPKRPQVPAGAVRLNAAGTGPAEAADVVTDTQAGVLAVATDPVERDAGASAPAAVEPGAAAAVREAGGVAEAGAPLAVHEWSDEDFEWNGAAPGGERVEGRAGGLRAWAVAAVVLLAIILGLILWESSGCASGKGGGGNARDSVGVEEVTFDADSR